MGERFAPLFVTPAYRRLDLSEVVFEQRRRAIDDLRAVGIEADCVVIADDENLELARVAGFRTVERSNEQMGRKWNDGYETSVLDGFTHFVPIGSDSLVVPNYFLGIDPLRDVVTTGEHYALVDERGERLARTLIRDRFGVGPHVVPTRFLEKPYRPLPETLGRGADGALMAYLAAVRRSRPLRGGQRGLRFDRVDVGPLQYVGLRTKGLQMNPYSGLVGRYGTDQLQVAGPRVWEELAGAYGPEIADRLSDLYRARIARREA